MTINNEIVIAHLIIKEEACMCIINAIKYIIKVLELYM